MTSLKIQPQNKKHTDQWEYEEDTVSEILKKNVRGIEEKDWNLTLRPLRKSKEITLTSLYSKINPKF